MSRRSTPQRKTDDAAFPVRMFLRVPSGGLGIKLDAIHRWLAQNLGRGEYAVHAGGRHPGQQSIEDRIAIYTRTPSAAKALMAAFPDLELSDGTEAVGYSSPALPFGRGG